MLSNLKKKTKPQLMNLKLIIILAKILQTKKYLMINKKDQSILIYYLQKKIKLNILIIF